MANASFTPMEVYILERKRDKYSYMIGEIDWWCALQITF